MSEIEKKLFLREILASSTGRKKMNIKELKSLWLSDLYRYSGTTKLKDLLKCIVLVPGHRYSFYMRLCNYLNKKIQFLPFFVFFRIVLMHYETKFGISIPFDTQIGKGSYIGHFGNIVVNSKEIIGNNCNISQGVTIGIAN